MTNKEEIKRGTQGYLVNRMMWKVSVPHLSPKHGHRGVYSCTALFCLTALSQDLVLALAEVCALL